MDQDEPPGNLTSVMLTRKYAEAIDGVDLSGTSVGDRLKLSSRDARMLIAEGWAAPCDEARPLDEHAVPSSRPEEQ